MSRRVSFGLFVNTSPMIILLFYLFCLITIFLPHLTLAQSKSLTFNTENDLKIIQTDTYKSGTILFRLTKPSQTATCNNKILWFNILQADGTSTSLTIENHPIPKEDFCLIRKNVLVKRHPQCDGDGAKSVACCESYPDRCKDPVIGGGVCSTNPDKEGCGDFCKDNPGQCNGKNPKTPETPADTPKTPADTPPATPQPGTPENPQPGTPENPQPGAPGTTPPGTPGTTPPGTPGTTPPGAPGTTPPGTTPPGAPGTTPPGTPGTPPPPGTPVPSTCKDNPQAPECNTDCNVNPYGPGCNVDCSATPTPPGCNNIPDCSSNPVPNGCKDGILDCRVYPNAPTCKPDCSKNPDAPRCNDCTINPNASGCEVCNQNQSPLPERCNSGYCDRNPDLPECSFIKVDGITIHAIKEEVILVKYYCNPTSNDSSDSNDSNNDYCGILINWEGSVIGDVITFEKSCSHGKIVKSIYEKGFLYTCYKSESREIFWATFGAPSSRGEISIIQSSTITNIDSSSTVLTSVFGIEDGGYGVVAVSDSIIVATFIQKDSTVRGPFKIYTPQTLTGMHVFVCNIAYQSSGYSCVIQVLTIENQATLYEIDFLSDGTVTQTTEIKFAATSATEIIIDVDSLNYGGYVITTKDSVSGIEAIYVYDNKGTYQQTLSLPTIFTGVLILPNNTVVAIPKDSSNVDATDSGSTTVVVETTDQLTTYSTIEGGDGTAPGGPGDYGSAKILSTNPSKGSVIPINTEEFTITYTIPIAISTGSISIYRVNGTDAVLKQTVSATDEKYVKFDNETVRMTILKSVINKVNVPYYVTIDSDFAKEQSNNQNVIGIRENIWNFTTSSDQASSLALITGGSSSAIIRLTTEGTKYYKSLSTDEKILFVDTMSGEFARSLPCDRERLYTTHDFQYAHTKEDQIIMRVDVAESKIPNQPSSEQLVDDLNDVIILKDYNSLATGDTSHLDASNGAPKLKKLWPRYWGFLLAAILLLIILILLFIFARLKNPDGRNFLSIFLFALIPIDLALDIAFIALHGKDYKWTFPATLFFLLFPIFLNIIFTNHIIKKEKGTSKTKHQFNKWWKNHKTSGNVSKAASYLDTDALAIMSSKAGGVESLSAPVSEEGEKSILYATGLVALLEDFPQFIIYIVYLRYHIKWAIVPILVMITCVIVLILKLCALLCFTCCFKRKPKDEEEGDKEKVVDGSSSSSSSSSSSEEDDRPPVSFAPSNRQSDDVPSDGARRPQDDPKNGPKSGDVDSYGNIPSGGVRRPTKDDPKDDPKNDPKDDPKGPKKGPKAGDFDDYDNIPTGSARRPQDKPKDEPKDEPKSGGPDNEDDDKPVDKPITPITAKKEPKTSEVPPDSDDKKKPGFISKFKGMGKKPKKDEEEDDKVTAMSNIGGSKDKDSPTDKPTDENIRTNVPVRDSGIRESTLEEIRNNENYLKKTEKDQLESADFPGTSNTTIVGIGGGYSGYGGYPDYNNNNKSTVKHEIDKLSIVTGAAIAGVTVSGGEAETRYLIITREDEKEEKEEKDKTIEYIKTSTTKTTSVDGDTYVTKTDGKEYITTYTGGRYITKLSIDGVEYIEYITTLTGDANEQYITKTTVNDEEYEYITTITTTITNTTTTTTPGKTSDDRTYITKSTGGKGYTIITTSTIEEFLEGDDPTMVAGGEKIIYETVSYEITNLSILIGGAISGVTVADGAAEKRYLIVTNDEKENATEKTIEFVETTTTKTSSVDGVTYITKSDGDKEYITTSTGGKYITKFSDGGVVYVEFITIITGERYITKTTINEEEYELITTIKTVTDTTTKTDDRDYITKLTGDQGDYIITTSNIEKYTKTEIIVTGEEVRHETGVTFVPEEVRSSSAKIPRRKQTRTNTRKETEGDFETTIETTTVTDEDGKVTTTVKTTKRDKGGNIISTGETTDVKFTDQLVEEPGETTEITTLSSKKVTPSIVGPSIYEEAIAKKGDKGVKGDKK